MIEYESPAINSNMKALLRSTIRQQFSDQEQSLPSPIMISYAPLLVISLYLFQDELYEEVVYQNVLCE